jgi:hypothetical protein
MNASFASRSSHPRNPSTAQIGDAGGGAPPSIVLVSHDGDLLGIDGLRVFTLAGRSIAEPRIPYGDRASADEGQHSSYELRLFCDPTRSHLRFEPLN